MTTCLVATGKHDGPNVSRVAWEDSTGYHDGIVELIEGRIYSRVVFASGSSTDTTQSLHAWMSKMSHIQGIRSRTLLMGQYYPRIHRPCSTSFPYEIPTYGGTIESSAIAVEVLLDRLDHLFRVIEPDTSNLGAYGHEIRNLLLLACMEAETAWSSVLRANGYPDGRWTTKDYVKLLGPLHLAEYELKLTSYPNVPPLAPFAGWNAGCPTQSLAWYDAYNQTKHDREGAFKVGTLGHVINAVAAAIILFYAQFGQSYYEDDPMEVRLRFRQFHVTRWPDCPPEEWYLAVSDPPTWTAVAYAL